MKVEYLILDYNRPNEAQELLKSVKDYSHFDHSVTYLANGGELDYGKELHSEGLIDNLILNKRNVGCGAGTIQLFAQSETKYSLYIQVDHVLSQPITQALIDGWIDVLKSGQAHCVSLSGDQNQGKYSERAQLINTYFYNSIPKGIGGPGPWSNTQWTEYSMHHYFLKHKLGIHIAPEMPFRDRGKWSVRSNPDGSVWRQRSDTKQLWMLKPPTEEFSWPAFSNEEWERVIRTQSWPDGKIPHKVDSPEHSFVVHDSYWERR